MSQSSEKQLSEGDTFFVSQERIDSGYLTPYGRGYGRGLRLKTEGARPKVIPHYIGRETISVDSPSPSGGHVRVGNSPVHNSPGIENCVSSTPNANVDHDLVGQMGTLMERMGLQITDAILSQLKASRNEQNDEMDGARAAGTPDVTVGQSQLVDISQLNMVVRSDLKEPPCFRGDDTDKLTVDEWEEVMKNYVKKNNFKVVDQAEEILLRLRGRAKDIVKVGIRNCGEDSKQHPDIIYSILRQYFSVKLCSPIPMADFYNTLPSVGEDAFEYWLRLNKAAETAIECLARQGKRLDDLSVEVARMFIRNCPDRELALAFKGKTIDKWMVHEVQEVINEYHSEKTLKSAQTPPAKNLKAAYSEPKAQVAVHHMGVRPYSDTERVVMPQQPQSGDSLALERVIGLLEKALLQSPWQARPNTRRPQRFNQSSGGAPSPCAVCGDTTHHTRSHCIFNNLCFQCFSKDHSIRDCPGGKDSRPESSLQTEN